MPDHEVALELLGRTGPLAVSSANLTGRDAATDADQAQTMLGDAVEVYLDGGPTAGNVASTIVDCTGETGRVLRAGVIPLWRLNQVVDHLGVVVESPESPESPATPESPESPGSRRRCASTSPSSWSPRSSPTCSAWWPVRSRCGPGRWPRSATVTCTRCRSRTSGGWRCSAASVAGFAVAHQLPFLSLSDDQIFRDAGVVLVAGALICAVGVLDDLLELDALTKFGGQLLAAGLLVFFDVQYYTLQLPGGGQVALDTTQAAIASVVVVVATVNAVNFVDGLDGLAAGVVGIGAVAFFLFSYQLADANNETLAISAALLTAALAGATAGFLPHNFFPARIFMGDSGSMLIGLVLAGSALTLTGQFPSAGPAPGSRGERGQPAAHAAADHPAHRDPHRALRRPRPRRGPPYPRRPVTVRPGQAAPAPPPARDRALPSQGGADHVAVGRPDRVRWRARQPVLRQADHGGAGGLGGAHRGVDVLRAPGAPPADAHAGSLTAGPGIFTAVLTLC